MAIDLTLSKIAEAINANKPVRGLLSTYLHDKPAPLTALDVRQLLNTPNSLFKKIIMSAIAACENLEESIRANIREITQEEQKTVKQGGDDDSSASWFNTGDIVPRLQLTKPKTYTKQYIEELLLKYRLSLPKLRILFVALLGKFQLLLAKHRTQYDELARQHQLVLSLKHCRELHDHYLSYHLSKDPEFQTQLIKEFAHLQGAPLEESAVHRFFNSAPLMRLMNNHRAERLSVESELTDRTSEIIYCYQACIKLASPLNYTLAHWLMANPNFEYTPKPTLDNQLTDVQREMLQHDTLRPSPFPQDPVSS